jgi:acyl carrier protein
MNERLTAQGLGLITPDQGLAAMARLLDAGSTQAVVLSVDWPRFIAQRRGANGFVADLACPTVAQSTRAASGATASADLRQRIADVPAGRQRAVVAAFVRERAVKALGLDPARSIDPRTPLGELGLDSLLAVELRNTLGHAIGMPLPATLLFDYPTLETLTDYLYADALGLREGAVVAARSEAASAAPGASLVDSIEGLSDDEVDRLLAQRTQ